MIKKATRMNNSDYINFVEKYSNQSFVEIEDINTRNKIIQKFASINSNRRKGNREYNEMYGSNPNIMGVFAYEMDYNKKINKE